jgi:hypothetical protein
MSQKNIIYICCIATPWIKVMENLRSHGLVPRYVVHWRDEMNLYLNSNFNDCFLQTVEDAWAGKGFPVDTRPTALDEEQLKSIAWNESQALIMMNRLDPTEVKMNTASRQYYFRDLVGYWLSIIKEKSIEVVGSPSIARRIFG